MQNNLVLIGPSGSGKSYLGKELAKQRRMGFIDLDELISQRAGMSIAGIFKKHGETGFREIEHEVLLSLEKTQDCVISTGGGIVTNKNNLEPLNALGKLVLLHGDVRHLFRNLGDGKSRPLLRSLTKRGRFQKLCALLRQRSLEYLITPYAIDISFKHKQQVLSELECILEGSRSIVSLCIGEPRRNDLSRIILRKSLIFTDQIYSIIDVDSDDYRSILNVCKLHGYSSIFFTDPISRASPGAEYLWENTIADGSVIRLVKPGGDEGNLAFCLDDLYDFYAANAMIHLGKDGLYDICFYIGLAAVLFEKITGRNPNLARMISMLPEDQDRPMRQ